MVTTKLFHCSGVFKDLRQQSAEYANSNQVGNAMGGLSVETS
jgi:hypothetical protein